MAIEEIGSKLILMADKWMIDEIKGDATVKLNHPVSREIAIVFDQPWEGNASACYVSIFKDIDTYKMYYRGVQYDPEWGKENKLRRPPVICYAQSKDGIRWEKPELKLCEFNGRKDNNIVYDGENPGEFCVFKDTNPDCPLDQKYKMIIAKYRMGMYVLVSHDGFRWWSLKNEPIISKGYFDSQNIAFWDEARKEYRAYFRGMRGDYRDILTATSKDFVNWSEPVFIEYSEHVPEHLYTNVIAPYYRCPDYVIGFPARYVEKDWSPSVEELPNLEHRKLRASISKRYGTAITESLFMISRDRINFLKWNEAFLRPGPEINENWKYGDNYIAWHILETESHIENAPEEISLYASEGYWTGEKSWLRRFTIRKDGFVSVYAPMRGGEIITKPFIFEGNQLSINFSTSAAGCIKIEIQRSDGKPVDGFSMEECLEIFGDSLNRVVRWKKGVDVSSISGKPVRLGIFLKDADIYAFQFLKT